MNLNVLKPDSERTEDMTLRATRRAEGTRKGAIVLSFGCWLCASIDFGGCGRRGAVTIWEIGFLTFVYKNFFIGGKDAGKSRKPEILLWFFFQEVLSFFLVLGWWGGDGFIITGHCPACLAQIKGGLVCFSWVWRLGKVQGVGADYYPKKLSRARKWRV